MRKFAVCIALLAILTTPVYADTTTPADLWEQVKSWVVELLDFGPILEPGGNEAEIIEPDPEFGPILEPGG